MIWDIEIILNEKLKKFLIYTIKLKKIFCKNDQVLKKIWFFTFPPATSLMEKLKNWNFYLIVCRKKKNVVKIS